MSEEPVVIQQDEIIPEAQPVSEQAPAADVAAPSALERIISRFQRGVHYEYLALRGEAVPKPTLLQPGALLILRELGVRISFRVQQRELPILGAEQPRFPHREYIAQVTLLGRNGAVIGEGMGSFSTAEPRCLWRVVPTGELVPKEYWDTRDPSLLGGPDYEPIRKEGVWVIGRRMLQDNPAQHYNTAMKLAVKRAVVHATILAFALADRFTHDLEDFADAERVEEPGAQGTVSEGQVRRLFAIAKAQGIPRSAVLAACERDYKVSTPEALTQDQYRHLVARLENAGKGRHDASTGS